MDNFFDEEMQKTVFFPDSMAATEPVELRGKYFEDTRIYNVFPPELSDMGEHLGYLLPMGYEPLSAGLCGIETDKGAEFFFDGKPINVERYSLYQNIFSRNSGILETDVMSIKRAVILGCGSVGSLVALELARSGVGHFFLADPDTLEYHNLCRHQCGIEDVGDLKINALRRRLRNINPSVEVVAVDRVIQDAPKDLLDDFCSAGDTIFVGCADNRAADVYSNRISVYYDAPFISIGFWERAFAKRNALLRVRIGQGVGPVRKSAGKPPRILNAREHRRTEIRARYLRRYQLHHVHRNKADHRHS